MSLLIFFLGDEQILEFIYKIFIEYVSLESLEITTLQ